MKINFVESPQNKIIQSCKKIIKTNSYRKKFNKTVLDGKKLISDYAGHFGLVGIDIILAKSVFEKGVHQTLPNIKDATISVVPDRLIPKISTVEQSQGVVAIIPIPPMETCSNFDDYQLILGVDGVQDPGNVGAILRICAAFNVDLVVLSKECSEIWSPKSLRAGMGAQFHQKCISVDINSVLKNFNGRKLGLSSKRGESITKVQLETPLILVVGSEGRGLSNLVESNIDSFINIPLSSCVESLNVASSVAISLYEANKKSYHGGGGL